MMGEADFFSASPSSTTTCAPPTLCCGVARAELLLSPRHRAPRDRGGTTSSCTASFVRCLLVFLWLCHAAHALLPAAASGWHARRVHRSAYASRRTSIRAQEIDEKIGMAPSEWLAANADERLGTVLEALLASCAQIATKVRVASCDSTSCFSPASFGGDDEGEMAIDVLANDLLVSSLRATRLVSVISSQSDGVEEQQPAVESCCARVVV